MKILGIETPQSPSIVWLELTFRDEECPLSLGVFYLRHNGKSIRVVIEQVANWPIDFGVAYIGPRGVDFDDLGSKAASRLGAPEEDSEQVVRVLKRILATVPVVFAAECAEGVAQLEA